MKDHQPQPDGQRREPQTLQDLFDDAHTWSQYDEEQFLHCLRRLTGIAGIRNNNDEIHQSFSESSALDALFTAVQISRRNRGIPYSIFALDIVCEQFGIRPRLEIVRSEKWEEVEESPPPIVNVFRMIQRQMDDCLRRKRD